MATRNLIAALARYGRTSSENLDNLNTWLTEALTDMKDGKGSQLTSGQGNGVAFTTNTEGMTIQDWYSALDMAIYMVDNNVGVSSRSRIKFS